MIAVVHLTGDGSEAFLFYTVLQEDRPAHAVESSTRFDQNRTHPAIQVCAAFRIIALIRARWDRAESLRVRFKGVGLVQRVTGPATFPDEVDQGTADAVMREGGEGSSFLLVVVDGCAPENFADHGLQVGVVSQGRVAPFGVPEPLVHEIIVIHENAIGILLRIRVLSFHG